MTDCPNTEKLSEFIDAKLSPEDRVSVVAHLGDCADCYAVVAESLAVREELGNRSRAQTKKYLFTTIPASLAAAAVLLIAFRILQPAHEFTSKPERELAYQEAPIEKEPMPKLRITEAIPSFANELSRSLAGNVNAVLLARIAENHFKPATSYGFSSIVPLEKSAFRIGVCLTDLEVALKAKDKGKIEVFAKKLIELLKPMESSYGPITVIIEQRAASGDSGKEAGRYEGFSSAVEALFKNKKEAVYLNFGEWVEAAGLAAYVRDAAFFQPAVVRHFKKELEMSGVPVGTLNNLSQLESLPSSGGSQTDQFKTRTRLLADIKEMF